MEDYKPDTISIIEGTNIRIRRDVGDALYKYGGTEKYKKRFHQWTKKLMGSNGKGEHLTNLMDAYRSVVGNKILTDENMNDKSIYYYRGFLSAINIIEDRIKSAAVGEEEDDEEEVEEEGDDVEDIMNNSDKK